jgi:hypothetical protein
MEPLLKNRLGWRDERWDEEVRRYRRIWTRAHGRPEGW